MCITQRDYTTLQKKKIHDAQRLNITESKYINIKYIDTHET